MNTPTGYPKQTSPTPEIPRTAQITEQYNICIETLSGLEETINVLENVLQPICRTTDKSVLGKSTSVEVELVILADRFRNITDRVRHSANRIQQILSTCEL